MTHVTITGNLTAEPELRFTATGKAVASFTVAESSRVKDPDGTWRDGDSTFWRCSIWDTAAENLAESLTKGQRVIVVGEAKQRSFETRDGEKRTVIEVTAQDVGASLKWATVKATKATRSSAAKPASPAEDPWGSAPAINSDDEPPF
jgi:single-strand DNA-binding protein